ncbi:hypothetical protein LJR230_003774 [Trinickia sp. LjRoot230]|uniref:hypothetical protein n=1 Tax=Trinickia sp. LjRoot230 TaxID=3342288 RepID=UPI003ECF0E66
METLLDENPIYPRPGVARKCKKRGAHVCCESFGVRIRNAILGIKPKLALFLARSLIFFISADMRLEAVLCVRCINTVFIY